LAQLLPSTFLKVAEKD